MKYFKIFIFGLILLLSACNKYENINNVGSVGATFLNQDGVTVGYYSPQLSSTNTGKVALTTQVIIDDYTSKEVVNVTVNVIKNSRMPADFTLSNAWVTLSVGMGSVIGVDNSPTLGAVGNFSNPVKYKIFSVNGTEKLYQFTFIIK